jgi:hypothetical protein
MPESLPEMAERYVREGTIRVERQRQIQAEMERDNHPPAAETAQRILATTEISLRLSRAHLRRFALLEVSDPHRSESASARTIFQAAAAAIQPRKRSMLRLYLQFHL